MNVLITGASGFIGSSITQTLLDAGHTVRRAVRTPKQPSDVAVQFERDIAPADWLARLDGIDAVVNAVGLLGGSESAMMAVHRDTPTALAAACAQRGIKRFVQMSALGVDSGLATRYFRSKLAGEQAVRAALPGAHIVRPSLVFGHGGASSKMFMQLTRLPMLMLPKAGRLTVQPVHVHDVCAAVAALLNADPAGDAMTLDAVGPQAMNMADYLASLAAQLGRRAPYILPMPAFVASSSAQLMQHLPQTVWTPETLAMLVAGSSADPAGMAALLGRSALAVDQFVAYGR